MKKFFVSLIMLLSLSAASVFAQSSQIATLSHEGEITAFYGANALKEAYEAAAHGDAITLSSGTFIATDISKNLIIRGAGMQIDTVTKCMPTVITGDFTIGRDNTAISGLTIEGIYHNHTIRLTKTIEKTLFAKCRFRTISFESVINNENLTFLHCLITNKIDLASSTGRFVNSIINNPSNGDGSWEFVNCYVKLGDCHKYNAEVEQYIYNSTFINCIMRQRSRHSLRSSNIAYNCVCPTPCDWESYRLFRNIPNRTNSYTSCDVLFETYWVDNWNDDDLNDSDSFELTEEAKKKFLGTDGTQVGIYGGNFPYNPTTTNPHITKCNVAAKSTADGKLSVDIEVNGVE